MIYKALLYELVIPDEVRQSSLKGRTTVTERGVGLQRQKLDPIYSKLLIHYTKYDQTNLTA